MKYKIVIDSCGELPFQYQNDIRFERVPLGLEVEGEVIMDDENFDQADFLKRWQLHRNAQSHFARHPRDLWRLTGLRQRMYLYLPFPPN